MMTELPPLDSAVLSAGIRARFVENVNGLRMHMLEAGFETPGRPGLLLLHGFPVGGGDFFPPVPANKVAVGFLVGAATPQLVSGAMQYLITGKAPEGVTYKLRRPGGYPGMIGAMFWTIDGDREENYGFSNLVGPQLHGYPSLQGSKAQ